MENLEIMEKNLHYYLESTYDLIGEWKKGDKNPESTMKLLREMANFSKDMEKCCEDYCNQLKEKIKDAKRGLGEQ